MQNIDSDLIRGNIDTIILKTMLNEDKYGLDIIKEVEQRSSGTYELKQPTLYSCLKRLENQELISSYWVNSDIGGRRHYYKLTDKGRDFYNKKQEEWAKSKFVIDNLLSSYNYEEYRLVKKDDYDKVMSAENADEQLNEDIENEISDETITENSVEIEESANEQQSELNTDEIEELDSPTLLFEENEEDEINTDEASSFDEFENETYNESNEEETFSDELENEIDEDAENLEDLEETPDADSETQNDDIDNDLVYVNSNNEECEEEDIENYPSYELPDQTQNEANILSMLHKQKNEEVNTYEGDKKSYANQIKSIYDDVKYVQDDMTFVGHEDHEETDEVDQKLKEWTDAANKLDEFENSLHSEEDVQEDVEEFEENNESNNENVENIEDSENLEENQEFYDEDLNFSDESMAFDENSSNEDSFDFDFNNSDDEENKDFVKNTLTYSDEDEGDYGLNFDENEEINQVKQPLDEETFDFSVSDDEEENIDEPIEELEPNNTLEDFQSDTSSFFANNSEIYHNTDFQETNYSDFNDATTPVSENNFNQTKNDNLDQNQFIPFSSGKFNQDEYDSTFVNVKKVPQFEDVSSGIENSDIDSIISKNVSSQKEPSANNFYERHYTTENYKQKLSNLTVYSRASTDKITETKTQKNENTQADDLENLKESFEREGIKIKEHKKLSKNEEAEKTYLLSNKISLITSLILLFCFAFALSGTYLILKNTSFAYISENFKFSSFLIGILPFVVVVLYHLVKFIISPYKKVPARFASRIMIFLSVILTVQLLLITYCINLQLGFFSFTQAGYNHLLWVIPTIISFGPVISNLIYTALFYSGNFNV